MSKNDAPARVPVPADLLEGATTLTNAFLALMEHDPDRVALSLVEQGKDPVSVTLRWLWDRSKQVQAALEAQGVGRGDRVVLILSTGPELIAGYFGSMLAGGVPALVATPSNRVSDHRIYRGRVGGLIERASASAVYCAEDVAEILADDPEGLLSGTPIIRPSDAKPTDAVPETVLVEPHEIATLQYTSGSTGPPNGVLLSHGAMVRNILAVREGLRITASDVHVNWAPLYHDMGLIDTFLLPLMTGCEIVLIPTMEFLRQPSFWLRTIHEHRGCVSWAPNFAYALCAKRVPEEELEGLDLSSWRVAVNGAEPVHQSTLEAFAARFAKYGFDPRTMSPGWGMAENVTMATTTPTDEIPTMEIIDRQKIAREGIAVPTREEGISSVSVGRAVPHVEIQIRSEEGEVLEDRHLGEIWIRTNCLFDGYIGNSEVTDRVLVDGWLHTRDRGYLADGHLFFFAREKDLIVIGGEKYAPHDVEAAINLVPGVREGCAVAFGVMNDDRGTEELAVVAETKVEGEQERKDLAKAIRLEVTRTIGVGVRHLKLVSPGGIEKTTSGKLARFSTQSRYADEFK